MVIVFRELSEEIWGRWSLSEDYSRASIKALERRQILLANHRSNTISTNQERSALCGSICKGYGDFVRVNGVLLEAFAEENMSLKSCQKCLTEG
jgi:hypothetical protein